MIERGLVRVALKQRTPLSLSLAFPPFLYSLLSLYSELLQRVLGRIAKESLFEASSSGLNSSVVVLPPSASSGHKQPSSQAVLTAMRGYTESSFKHSRVSVDPLLVNASSFRPLFMASLGSVLKASSVSKYNSAVNGFRHYCIATGLEWTEVRCDVRVTLDLLASYCYYYVGIKPHSMDKPGFKVFHSTNSLSGIYSGVKEWAEAESRFDMNQREVDAFFDYIKVALPRIYPPSSEPRVPIRLDMLVRAWNIRGSHVKSINEKWLALRDKTYCLLAHQGLFRTEELRNMLGSDIYFSRSDTTAHPISVTFIIREAKTSNKSVLAGEQKVHLPYRPLNADICPVTNLLLWLRTLKMVDHDFRLTSELTLWPTSLTTVRTVIHRDDILSNLRSDMSLIGVPADQLHNITAHGLRTGGTCDYRDSGADPHSIIQHGRWSSEAYRRYFATSHETSASILQLRVIPLARPTGQLMEGKVYAGDSSNQILMGIAAASTSTSPESTSDVPSVLVSSSASQLSRAAQPALGLSLSKLENITLVRSFTFSPIVNPEVRKRTLLSSGLIGPNSTLTVSPIQDVDDEVMPPPVLASTLLHHITRHGRFKPKKMHPMDQDA